MEDTYKDVGPLLGSRILKSQVSITSSNRYTICTAQQKTQKLHDLSLYTNVPNLPYPLEMTTETTQVPEYVYHQLCCPLELY